MRNDPLTIALYGENTLNDSQIYAWNSDLEGDGAIYLTIEKSADAPSGSLSVTCSGNKWGAIMPGDLTVRGGAQVILVKKDGSGDTGNCGINADGCNVIIEGEGTKLDITNTETDKPAVSGQRMLPSETARVWRSLLPMAERFLTLKDQAA